MQDVFAALYGMALSIIALSPYMNNTWRSAAVQLNNIRDPPRPLCSTFFRNRACPAAKWLSFQHKWLRRVV